MSVVEVEILTLWSQEGSDCPVTSSAFPLPEVAFFFWRSW